MGLNSQIWRQILDRKSLRTIRKFILGRRVSTWIILSMICGTVIGAVEIGLALVLQFLLVALGVTENSATQFFPNFKPTVTQIALVIVSIGLIRGALYFVVVQSATVVKETINRRLRQTILFGMLQWKQARFIPASRIHHLISETFQKASNHCFYWTLVIPAAIQCAFLIGFMFYTSYRDALVGLAGLSLGAFAISFLNKRIYRAGERTLQEQQKLVSGIERVARNWLLVKIFRTENAEYDQLKQNTSDYAKHSIFAATNISFSAVLPSMLGFVLLSAIIVLSSQVWLVPPLVIVSFLYLFLRFVQTLGQLSQNFSSMVSFLPQFIEALDTTKQFSGPQLLAELSDSREAGDSSLEVNSREPLASAPAISVDRLKFSYTRKESIFSDLSFSVGSGRQLGIVGPSGVGKSTLLSLLLGILKPDDGEIKLDEVSPGEFYERYVNQVGYVGPEPFLIEGNLRSNVIYGGSKDTSDQEIFDALKYAQLNELMKNKGNGLLEYQIAENGEGLSAGQKQRLSLARALLRKPKLLILDEVSANLDEQTELDIAETIKNLKGETTTIIVSHRKAMLRYADQVINLG